MPLLLELLSQLSSDSGVVIPPIVPTIVRPSIAHFSDAGIEDGLPPVTITFDGSEDFMTCFTRLATMIDGYAGVDYSQVVSLFLVDTHGPQPDPIDETHRPLIVPSPINFGVDLSQIRNKIFGQGAGDTIPVDLPNGEVIVPMGDVSQFNPNGGLAIGGTIPSGALSERMTYEGIHPFAPGSIVGQGVTPVVAPTLTPSGGTGVNPGDHQYAYTYGTGSGDSLPSPLGLISIAAAVSRPTILPTLPSSPSAGNGPDPGYHTYGNSFVTSSGETDVLTSGNNVSTYNLGAPPFAPSIVENSGGGNNSGFWPVGASVYYVATNVASSGETVATGHSNTIVAALSAGGVFAKSIDVYIEAASDPNVISKWLYRNVNGAWTGRASIGAGTTMYTDSGPSFAAGSTAPPSSSTVPIRQIFITGIQNGPPGVTGKKLWRTVAGGTQLKFLALIPNNTTTTFTDNISDSSLGANAPTTNTATLAQVSISGISIGPAGVTNRKIWRTPTGSTQLKLLFTVPDNTTTTYLDLLADSALGTNIVLSDTSGLTVIAGQVNSGSTSIQTAGAGPFYPSGGWALSGSQYIRYTGITGNTLTGIPPSGPGSIINTIKFGEHIDVAPALVGINHWNGLRISMLKGSGIDIWVEYNDYNSQLQLGQLELDRFGKPTDGVHEYKVIDRRRSEESLLALCAAEAKRFGLPLVSTTFYTRGENYKSGKTVNINLKDVPGNAWGQGGDFVIQSVNMVYDDPSLNPLCQVQASSTSFRLTDLIRHMALTSGA